MATVSNAEMNIGVHIVLQLSIFEYFSWIYRKEIAGLYGSFTPIFLRNLHTVVHSSYMKLHS